MASTPQSKQEEQNPPRSNFATTYTFYKLIFLHMGGRTVIVYEDRNRIGHDAAQDAFDKLVSAAAPASAIERASYLYGMQTFCRHQLKRELTSAMDALEGSGFEKEDVEINELVTA